MNQVRLLNIISFEGHLCIFSNCHKFHIILVKQNLEESVIDTLAKVQGLN